MAVHDPEFLRRAAEARARIRELDPTAVDTLRAEGAKVLDVRELNAFEAGHIEGAEAVPIDTLTDRIKELAPDLSTPLICYCNAGNRGALAADALQKLGYLEATSIAGGLEAYQAQQQKGPHGVPNDE